MGPEALAQVLRHLTKYDHPALLVGLKTGDDAAVYRLDAEHALVQTVDFFPPVVDDPYTYGAIAAANSMSDVYAMGGEVLLALNIAAFPDTLPPEVLADDLPGRRGEGGRGRRHHRRRPHHHGPRAEVRPLRHGHGPSGPHHDQGRRSGPATGCS